MQFTSVAESVAEPQQKKNDVLILYPWQSRQND